MSEEVQGHEQPVVDPFLGYTKQTSIERLVSHLNGVGASIINAYPMAEVQSWTLQRAEALTVISVDPVGAHLVAPFITKVCEAHFGPATPEERAQQIVTKAGQILANAEVWAALSAYVNGLRARAQDQIEGAGTAAEVNTVLHEVFQELEQFRQTYGI